MKSDTGTEETHGFRWWWILPALAALLGGISSWLFLRRGRMRIQPVRIDLSFVRSQPFRPEGAAQPPADEIVIPILQDEPSLSGSNGSTVR